MGGAFDCTFMPFIATILAWVAEYASPPRVRFLGVFGGVKRGFLERPNSAQVLDGKGLKWIKGPELTSSLPNDVFKIEQFL